jgi:Fur family ferric uptake transcriptional regulator
VQHRGCRLAGRFASAEILEDNGAHHSGIAASRGGSLSVETSDLRKAGLKITLPRVKILEILAGHHGRHMSAEDIYRALIDQSEDIGLATVYRVLTQFEAAQLVKRHHFEGGTAVFELNEGEHHDHIICMDCGRVEEFMDCGIERRQNDVATRLGFAIEEHNLILYGRCRRENCPHRRKRS